MFVLMVSLNIVLKVFLVCDDVFTHLLHAIMLLWWLTIEKT